MTKGITDKEADPRILYADIIDLPHHRSSVHPHMPLQDRAAQFASYKALSGFEDMVAEEARLTDREPEPEEHELDVLNRKLHRIADAVAAGESPLVSFTVFVPDDKKAGGEYKTITDYVKKIDPAERKVVLWKKRDLSGIHESIAFDRITDISWTEKPGR